jgi:FKBP-type peptidyl-prolyl cis-trans isomerase
MEQNKKVAVIGTVVTVLVLAGAGGFLYWKSQHRTVNALDASSASGSAGTIDGSTIQLNSAAGSGGLSVGSGSATGQLSTGNQSGTQQANSTSNNRSSSTSQGLDPSTFSQYEKYKNESHALFGDIAAGNGDALTAGKKAAVYYKGWLTNGTLFDQSRTGSDGKPQPFIFTEGEHKVIPGWEEGLAGMKAGGTRLVIIPPAVGYGAQGQANIPPNSVLVFQVELLAVQ